MSKKKLVFMTGAGISAESGIQTFRDSNGLWEGHDVKAVATPEGWRRNRELVLEFYNQRRRQLLTCEPNEAHKIIASLEEDFDVTVITQNVDDLHERAGSTKVIHLHGELLKACSSMNKELTLPWSGDINIGDKHEDGSQLRPYIVWFGEDVPLMHTAGKEAASADLFVVVGTSLRVYPAASLADYTKVWCKKYYVDTSPAQSEMLDSFTIIQKVATQGMKDLAYLLKTTP